MPDGKLDWSNPFNKINSASAITGIAPKLGGLAGNALSGGLSSGAGNVLSGLSGVAGAIPGPWGAVASTGLQVLGGATNALFGTKVNQAELNRVNSTNSALSNAATAASNASSFDDAALNGPNAINFGVNAYKGGVFSSGSARRKNQALADQLKSNYEFALNSVDNSINNIANNQTNGLLANYAAYGGPLEYDMQKTYLDNMYMGAKDSKMTSLPNSFMTNNNPMGFFADGGGIHIKKSHEGLFTKKANAAGMGVQEYASHVLANKENYPSSTVKQANFARNFGGHKKDDGGTLMTQGADFSNGITMVNNGGTHEQNPQQGVPMGIAPDGQPNLVEEGEVVYNDYVFSNRLKAPKSIKEKYHLKDGATFADAAKKVSKESEERPNDPISKAGLNDSMNTLLGAQEEIRMKKETKKMKKEAEAQQPQQFAKGGLLEDDDDITRWIPGVSPIPEVTINPESIDLAPLNDSTLFDLGSYSFGDTNPQINTNIASPKVSLDTGLVDVSANSKNTTSTKTESNDLPTWMRYAPIFGSALGFGLSYLPTDYSNAERVEAAANAASDYDRIAFNPIGNYLTYNPFDINYTANQLRASEQANARNILNTSGGNRGTAMAGLLANNYNSQLALANAYRQAADYNLAQRQKVEEFNRGTNMTNSQGFLEADKANQAARAQAQGQRLAAIESAAKMRQVIDDARDTSRAANFSNLFTSLGNIGKENYSINDRDRLINEGVFGTLSEKPQEWSDAQWDAYRNNILTQMKSLKSDGGKLNKKRKNLTY